MFYYIFLTIILIVFVALNAFVFPAFFLRKWDKKIIGDRAVRDIAEKGGRSIIYCPDVKYRAFIKHYVVSVRGGKTIVKCETDGNLRYINYDIYMFNRAGKVFKVLNVSEVITREGYTEEVELDGRTAYVSIVINKADKTTFKNRAESISAARVILYALFCSAVDIVAAFAVKYCVAQLFGGIYAESFLYSFSGNLITLGLCAAIVALNVLITVFSIKKSSCRAKKGDTYV